ncbi:807_t:CDS:2 [Funneliformis geosporum]|nr:807_t:CDS:2 [Funneliformis geosporum]
MTDKDTRPIVFGRRDGSGHNYDRLFLDMVNKELITGEKLITQYHHQLPVMQEQNQVFSLVYDGNVKGLNLYYVKDQLTELKEEYLEQSLAQQNIEVFSKSINLEELCIGNDISERLKGKVYNHFHGSLESLKNLTKLKKLQIEATDVDSGEFKVKKIEEELRKFGESKNDNFAGLFRVWKADYQTHQQIKRFEEEKNETSKELQSQQKKTQEIREK